MDIHTAKKEGIRPFQNSKVKVDFGEKTVHSGIIDMRLSVSEMKRGLSGSPKAQEPSGNPAPKPAAGAPVKAPDMTGVQRVKKGQKLPLPQQLEGGFEVALRIDKSPGSADVDAAVFMVDTQGKTMESDFIFYNNPSSRCGGVGIQSAQGGLYMHRISVNPSLVPQRVQKLAFVLTSDGGDFSGVSGASVDIIDSAKSEAVMSFDLGPGISGLTGLAVMELYKKDGLWRISFIGNGFEGGLEALCREYGIDVE